MATLKDVASETGLSVGTISRVLNNRGYISQETRSLVDQAMKKLHYQPNELARSLSKSSSTIIGIIIPSLINPYFSALVQALENAAGRFGFQSMLFISNSKTEKEKEFLAQCQKNRVAGIILCSGRFSTLSLKNVGVPVITIERPQENATASIECDNEKGGRLAASHLIAKGCKHLLAITSIQGSKMPADKRATGFIAECENAGTEHHEVQYSEAIYESMDYQGFIKQLLSTFPKTDGLFCTSDVMASEALTVCHSLSIKVPESLKIVGFDDTPIARMVYPPLTTIHQPIKEMADMAIMTLNGAKEGNAGNATIMLGVTLIERETT